MQPHEHRTAARRRYRLNIPQQSSGRNFLPLLGREGNAASNYLNGRSQFVWTMAGSDRLMIAGGDALGLKFGNLTS